MYKSLKSELAARKNILFLCEILIVATIICVYILYGTYRAQRGEVCIYDNIVYSEYYGFEMVLQIPMVVIIQAQLRNTHRAVVIIHYKSIRSYWNNVCRKMVQECLLAAGIIMINICVLCAVLRISGACNKMCNWNMEDSRFRYVSGYVMSDYPSPDELFIYVTVQIFAVLFISVLITQLVYWISGSRSMGILASVIWIGLDRYTYLTSILFGRITLMPGTTLRKYGIGPVRCMCFPLLLCIMVYVISLCVVRKKDIMV